MGITRHHMDHRHTQFLRIAVCPPHIAGKPRLIPYLCRKTTLAARIIEWRCVDQHHLQATTQQGALGFLCWHSIGEQHFYAGKSCCGGRLKTVQIGQFGPQMGKVGRWSHGLAPAANNISVSAGSLWSTA